MLTETDFFKGQTCLRAGYYTWAFMLSLCNTNDIFFNKKISVERSKFAVKM